MHQIFLERFVGSGGGCELKAGMLDKDGKCFCEAGRCERTVPVLILMCILGVVRKGWVISFVAAVLRKK